MAESPSTEILDEQEAKQLEKATDNPQEDDEDVFERPGWLPDGWIMEVYRGDDGTILQYYTSPVSGFTFMRESEVLQYLFSGIDERFLESENCAVDNNLSRTHQWLPKGWLIEIRAGGENMDKMYKFYVYPPTGIRLCSKEDVLLYITDKKISGYDLNGQCDTSSQENILANVEVKPDLLPEGWVKEVVFRKTANNGIRRDPYYRDPVRNYAFRTHKSAMLYLETGKVTKRAFIPKTNVHELYSFEKSAKLHESLRTRLTFKAKNNQLPSRPSNSKNSSHGEETHDDEQSSYNSEDSGYYKDSDSPDSKSARWEKTTK
ncbi:hypothetical protein ABZP36_003431 [Zizania latifolia]